MKKFIAIFAAILLGWNYSQADVKIAAAASEKELVEQVLSAMVNGTTLSVSNIIAPGYIKAHGINASGYTLNTYSPVGYSIDKQLGNGIIQARIWGADRGWVHRLHFMVIKDAGNFYCVPGREPSEYMYIDSWLRVESSIVENDYSTTTRIDESKSRKLVNDLLYDMTNTSNFGTDGKKYIAPSYYKTNYITKSEYTVNYYSPKTYEIKRVSPDGTVVAEVYGADRGWGHELTFKVVVENAQYYVMPGGHTDSKYIHPWYSVKTDIISGDEVVTTKDERLEVVTKLMDRMTYNKDEEFGTDMILYIAPSYFKRNSIDPFSYKVNAYTPYGYSVTKNDGYGNIKVKIWGKDRSWEIELVFRVVKENDLWYLMPGEHHTGTQYVDPWYSATDL